MDQDWNKVASYEKALADKYGEDCIINIRGELTPEKYEEYRKESEGFYSKLYKASVKTEKVEKDGYRVSKRLLNKETLPRTCPICKEYSFDIKDDIYMVRFECCFMCYIDYVEGREEKWPERKEKLMEN